MTRVLPFSAIITLACLSAAGRCSADVGELITNGSFEQGLAGWTAWGARADLISVDSRVAHLGQNSARIGAGPNALYCTAPMVPGKAYELHLFYRIEGRSPRGNVAINYYRKDGGYRSAGFLTVPLAPGRDSGSPQWVELRKVFVPTRSAVSCQIAFTCRGGSTLWLDCVSLRIVPRPAGLKEPPEPWEGLKHRTQNPLFKELLTSKPGGYGVITWSHHLQRDLLPKERAKDFPDDASWQRQAELTVKLSAEHGMGYLYLPMVLDGTAPWRNVEFHRQMNSKYGTKYDVWTEGSASVKAGLENGAELLNPKSKEHGDGPAVSMVDPRYVESQEKILTEMARRFRDEAFVGVYCGRDEPFITIPEGPPENWGAYGKAMAREVLADYGFGRFGPPASDEETAEGEPDTPLRWIAYNRWAADRYFETRSRLYKSLHAVNPGAVYSPADYWFMSAFVPYDYPRLASCTDMFEIDPYASSAETRRGRGVYNHGFGPKFMSDLTGKPVRVIVQAFDYAGYKMNPEDLREWVSQSFRCGASAISYYDMDNPQYNDPERWEMMLHLAGTITRMNRLAIPTDPDTAVLYAWYTHMSQGVSTGADQVYAAHALVGEMAGSWYRFIADSQLERGERSLDGYKAVYLPLARYMTAQAAAKIEAYVREGGVLVCGDADAFASDLEGHDTSATRERILGIRTLGPENADQVRIEAGAVVGLKPGTKLPLFETELWGERSPGRAREIQVVDKNAAILAVYPDGKPAIVSRKLGKGRVITFAANPFAPQVAVDASPWPGFFKALQKSFGCKVDRPIWRFALPPPPPADGR